MATAVIPEERIVELLRQAAQEGGIRNPSKITKDTLMAVINYVAPRICDPARSRELTHVVTSTPETSWADSPGDADIFAPTPTPDKEPSEASTTEQDGTVGITDKRKRLCKTRWAGTTCEKADCDRAHPNYCNEPACREGRVPSCKFWHTVRSRTVNKRKRLCKTRWTGTTCTKADCDGAHPTYCGEPACREGRVPSCKLWHITRPGNGKRRVAAPSTLKCGPALTNPVRNHPKMAQELKVRLLSSQLEALKVKEKLAKLKRPSAKTDRSFADVAASALSHHLPGPSTPHATASQLQSPTTAPIGLDTLVPLLMTALANLQAARSL